jgi:hypothetical protein
MFWLDSLHVRVEALGVNPSEEQKGALINWIIENVPQYHWLDAACVCHEIPGMYTEFSMRSSENQCY